MIPTDLTGKMLTTTGCIDVRAPQASDINVYDIALALSRLARFNGHGNRMWTVAQHSILVSHIAENQALADWKDERDARRLALCALMHDAAEAYIGDIIRPLRDTAADAIKELESWFQHALYNAHPAMMPQPAWQPRIKMADEIALATELYELFDLRADQHGICTPDIVAQATVYQNDFDPRCIMEDLLESSGLNETLAIFLSRLAWVL